MSGADAPARSFPWRACDRCEQSDQCKSDSRTCADQAGSVNDFYARDMDAIVTQSTTSQTCAQCADCGLSYSDPSWVDMVLPHDEWVKLDPTVTAILCMNCMAKRAAKAGFTPTVEGLYGALSLATAQPATSQEGERERLLDILREALSHEKIGSKSRTAILVDTAAAITALFSEHAATPTPPTLSEDLRALGQAIGAEIDRQCSIGAGTCGTAPDGSGLFEVDASLDLNGFAQAMSLARAQVKAS